MTTTVGSRVDDLEKRRQELSRQLAAIGEMRPGSLAERYRKCGKNNCHCARPGAAGHGPSFSLTRQVGGKTVTRIIPRGVAVSRTRAQIAEYRRFRELVREMIEVSDRLCHERLSSPAEEAPEQDAQKKGSKRGLGRKSSKKSGH